MSENIPMSPALWLMAGALCLMASCSLTLDFGECEIDDDCRQIGAGLTCTEGFCISLEEAPECRVDADCADKAPRTECRDQVCVEPADDNDGGMEPDMSPVMEPDAPEVCSNSRCAEEAGDNFVCGAEGTCVRALSPQCNTVVGPIDRDNIFLIGSVLPTSGAFGGLGLPIQQAAELAVVEFNDASGLPNGQRVVMVGCDSAGDGEQGLAAVEHLANTLGVEAIVGPAFSSIFINATTGIAVPAGVMTISPSATSPLISGLDDQGLAWRTVASDVFQGVAIADLVRDLGLTRALVLNKGDAYGRGLRDRVSQELAAELGEENFVVLEYADPAGGAVDVGVVGDALGEQAEPEVVILLGTTEALALMQAYEGAIADDVEGGLTPPRYILTDGGKDATEFQRLIDNGLMPQSLIDRIEGTEPDHQNGSHFFNFDLRFRARNDNQPAGVFTPNAYDAVYLLGYAAIIAGTAGEISGATLADAMARLSDQAGSLLPVGPSEVGQARNKLISGDNFNFEGASGPLDFDLDLGEAPANVALWRPENRDSEIRFNTARRYEIGDDGRGMWSE